MTRLDEKTNAQSHKECCSVTRYCPRRSVSKASRTFIDNFFYENSNKTSCHQLLNKSLFRFSQLLRRRPSRQVPLWRTTRMSWTNILLKLHGLSEVRVQGTKRSTVKILTMKMFRRTTQATSLQKRSITGNCSIIYHGTKSELGLVLQRPVPLILFLSLSDHIHSGFSPVASSSPSRE
jgi:hypothetical protein